MGQEHEVEQIVDKLKGAIQQAKELGISQSEVEGLVASAFKPEEASTTQESADGVTESESLKQKLLVIQPEDLPKIPPRITFSEGSDNSLAMPDEASIKKLAEIIPSISSIICPGFQQAAFATERTETGFRGTMLFGYNFDFEIAKEKANLERSGLDKAAEDLKIAITNKARIINFSSRNPNSQLPPKSPRVILLDDDQLLNSVQLLVVRGEAPYNGYPCPANPSFAGRSAHQPLLITLSSSESAAKLKSLLAENPAKIMHTLVAILFQPRIMTELINCDGKPVDMTDPYYPEDISGVMLVPGNGTMGLGRM